MFYLNLIIWLILIKIIENVQISVPKSELKSKPKLFKSVDTKLGTIIGYEQNVNITNLVNKSINVFYGIPYSDNLPIGNLRFKKLKLIRKFPVQPYFALDFKPHCVQKYSSKYNEDDKFNEDCLYLNIYTPNLEFENGKCRKKYNVMIYFYAGLSSIYVMSPFKTNNSDSYLSYSGELFSSLYDTILVTGNFRQQLFANLYLENEYSGNLGLFDQHLIIKWVKENIKSFCGNDKITVFGNSYGSTTLAVHLISRYSKNLIDNAIMQSSTPFFKQNAPVTRNQIMLNSFLAIYNLGCLNLTKEEINEQKIENLDKNIRSKYFDYINGQYYLKEKLFIDNAYENWNKHHPNLDLESKFMDQANKHDHIEKDGFLDKEIIDLIKFLSKYIVNLKCLQEVDSQKILNLDRNFNLIEFGVYYDYDYIDTEAYLNYKLFNKLNTNKDLNLLIGNLKDEDQLEEFMIRNKFYNDQFNAPVMSKEDVKNRILELKTVGSYLDIDTKLKLIDKYTNESEYEFPFGYYSALENFKNELNYLCPIYFYSYYSSMTSNNVYNYLITYLPSQHFSSYLTHFDLSDYYWLGTVHGDETNYIFGMPFKMKTIFNDLDRKFSLKLLNLWTSFAKNGKMPNLDNGSEWPSSNKFNSKPKYVEINGHFLREKKFEFQKRCENIFKNLLKRYKL